MYGVCPVCQKNRGRNVYSHLFSVHNYTKEEIQQIKEANRILRTEEKYECKLCGSSFPHRRKLIKHKYMRHREAYMENGKQLQCPLCEYHTENHCTIVNHVEATHASSSGVYVVENAEFIDRASFESWKQRLQKKYAIEWIVCNERTYPNWTITQLRCSETPRSLLHFDSQGAPIAQKTVRVCTAFMKVTERKDGLVVEFCRNHCGHGRYSQTQSSKSSAASDASTSESCVLLDEASSSAESKFSTVSSEPSRKESVDDIDNNAMPPDAEVTALPHLLGADLLDCLLKSANEAAGIKE